VTGTAPVNGVELYYEVHGEGDWLVLAHEFSGGCKSWHRQVDVLSRRLRLLVYNNRGYPPSTVPEDPAAYSQEHSIEDLRQLMDQLGVARPVLGGFSMGGSIALNFALAHPGRVRALILAGTGTGSIDKAQNARDFGPIADRFLAEGPAKVVEDYLRGPTRVQLLRKSPADRPHVAARGAGGVQRRRAGVRARAAGGLNAVRAKRRARARARRRWRRRCRPADRPPRV
jgi:pimeloyl-ACP methyl ester carboxylesterase